MVTNRISKRRRRTLHPDVRKTGLYRHKYHIRALFQSIAFVGLVCFYCLYNEYVDPTAGETQRRLRSHSNRNNDVVDDRQQYQQDNNNNAILSSLSSSHRRLLEENGEEIDCNKILSSNNYDNDNNDNDNNNNESDNNTTPLPSFLSNFPQRRRTTLSKSQRIKRNLELQLCSEVEKAEPTWTVIWYCIGVLYMFLALAIVCDEFFVPALEEMAGPKRLNLSMDVAGATLMAAGGSAPELFTSLIGTFQESEVGIGTIVGSAVFNVLFVIAMCALFSKETLTLTWWPLFRDSSFYAVGLMVLAVFVGVVTKEEILLWEAIVLLGMYFIYILLMFFNRKIFKSITGKDLVYPDEMEDDDEDGNEGQSEQTTTTIGDAAGTGTEYAPGAVVAPQEGSPGENNGDEEQNGDEVDTSDDEDGTNTSREMLTASGRDGVLNTSEKHMYVGTGWQGTFRAGVLTMIRHPDTWLETAGVAIVAKIEGDVDKVFEDVDLNGDGCIDKEELRILFQKLDCELTDDELDRTFNELDSDGNGKIDKDEFTVWYVASEERLISQMKHIFERFDADKSGTISKDELSTLMAELEQNITEKEIEDVMDVMHKHGNPNEITYEEFSEWYKSSLLFQHQKQLLEEEIEGPFEALHPPFGESYWSWIKYIILLPLVGIMTLTIPNASRPGLSKWSYLSFILSIAHIGGYSYLMVWWAEVIGNTAGIPSVVMGLTILAAGTSVPDLLSSVIVARRGSGDMAVSSSIGSNIFDILVGLPLPWILYIVWPNTSSRVSIDSGNIWISILVLLGMLVFVIAAVHCQGWKLTKILAGMMILFYIAFLLQAILLEVPFETCINDLTSPPTPSS